MNYCPTLDFEMSTDVKVTYDTFNNTNIDLSSLPLTTKKTAKVIKEMLPKWIEISQNSNKHVLSLKLSPKHFRIHKYALKAGFTFHHANCQESVLTFCLRAHDIKICPYPAYKTVSIGVTGVVFNETLEKFIAIKEKLGPFRDWKAPTGGVDDGEEPVDAVVRELLEETGIVLKKEDATLIGLGWTPNFFGSTTDMNHVFAFRTDESKHVLKAQEDEIEDITWLSVADFKDQPVTLNINKPFIIQTMVQAAQNALLNQTGWEVNHASWASGKEIRFYTEHDSKI